MKQFTLKFTMENLKRHMDYDTDYIVTTRDNLKARIGDVTVIGDGMYRVESIYESYISGVSEITQTVMWEYIAGLEGFYHAPDFASELERIYGELTGKIMYTYFLRRLREEEKE